MREEIEPLFLPAAELPDLLSCERRDLSGIKERASAIATPSLSCMVFTLSMRSVSPTLARGLSDSSACWNAIVIFFPHRCLRQYWRGETSPSLTPSISRRK